MSKEKDQNQLFIQLLMKYQKRIYNFILLLVPNYADADDLMQETVSTMWSKFDTFQQDSNFTAWAIKIARNKILNFRRNANNKILHFSEESMTNILEESKEIFEKQHDRTLALQECLFKLAEYDRKLVSLRYEQDLPVKDISRLTGRSVNGLYHTMARIHKILLQCVQRNMIFWKTV